MNRYIKIILVLILAVNNIYGQESYTNYQISPREYTLAGVSIDGVVHLDHEMVIQKSGLVRGEKIAIPSDKISKAITNLWNQGLFSEVSISKEKTQGKKSFLKNKT